MDHYISREELLKEFQSLCGPQTGDGWDNMGVRNLIMRQKIVDVTPVVYGEWIFHDDDFTPWISCSRCNYESFTLNRMPFCSNCGAIMRKEVA